MVAAIVDLDSEVHHLASGQKSARGGFLNALVDGGNILAGDNAAHDGVFKHIAGAARQAFHFNPAVAKLTTPAGLLFVAALHLAFAAHGFAVGNLGRFEYDIHLEAAFGLFDRKLDMQLPHAGKQDVAGFFIASQTQGDVFVQQPLHGGVDLVFLAFFLGGEGVGNELRGQGGHLQGKGGFFIAEGVARAGVLELGNGHDGAGANGLFAGSLRFTLNVQ